MLHNGSCQCGAIRVTIDGDHPITLCHCASCRKNSGALYSCNICVPAPALRVVAGAPQSYAGGGGSGQPLTGFFCGVCATTLWRTAAVVPDLRFVKAGILDEPAWLDAQIEGGAVRKPAEEWFAERRFKWCAAVEGAKQVPTAPGA